MESISIRISSSPPIRNNFKTHKITFTSNFLLVNSLFNPNFLSNSIFSPSNSKKLHFHTTKKIPFSSHQTETLNHQSNTLLTPLSSNPFKKIPIQLSFLCFPLFSFPLSSLASETALPTEEISNKINLEAVLVSIDDFFNRYPFFVTGLAFIWLIVIPLTEEYLSKYKSISAINAFKKLRDDPIAQLLDIREPTSLGFLGSPNLKLLNKSVVQVEYSEADEEGFVRNTLGKFKDPANTVICVLDNFDGNSLKVAELLVKNAGFKEAYAIEGGIRGKNGWLAIQENLLPPSVHIFPKKRAKKSKDFETNGGASQQINADNDQLLSVGTGEKRLENGSVQQKPKPRSLSPYARYPDLKPPSSPTPSKPRC